MNKEAFLEQLMLVGVVMAYTTACLFLGWAVYTLTKMWLDHIQDMSRTRAETYHEQYNRVQRDKGVRDYEEKYGNYSAYWNK
jgi:hypothetical protein